MRAKVNRISRGEKWEAPWEWVRNSINWCRKKGKAQESSDYEEKIMSNHVINKSTNCNLIALILSNQLQSSHSGVSDASPTLSTRQGKETPE